MSVPFTKVTPDTAFNDPVVWRELIISIAERADEFLFATNDCTTLQQAVTAVYERMGIPSSTVSTVNYDIGYGALQNGGLYVDAVAINCGLFPAMLVDATPYENGGTQVFFQNAVGSIVFKAQSLSAGEYVYPDLTLPRKIRSQSDYALIDSPSCPRGIPTRGDICGWWMLEDLQRAMSLSSHRTLTFAPLEQFPGSTSSFHRSKTLRVWNRSQSGSTVSLSETITTTAPLLPLILERTGVEAKLFTTEYDFTYFGVQP